MTDKHTQLLDLRMSENKAKTGGLVSELHLAIGAKVRLLMSTFQMDFLMVQGELFKPSSKLVMK